MLARAKRVGVELDLALGGKLETYYRLLETWNRRINLTGLDLSGGPFEALDRLLIEPLVAARYIGPGTQALLDIGSGGGSPGVPLALRLVDTRVVLVESKVRKSVFLIEVARALELANVEVIATRFEQLLARPDFHEAFDAVCVRAVRIQTRTLAGLQAFLRPGGCVFLFGSLSQAAVRTENLPPSLTWISTVPLLEVYRTQLVILKKR